MRTTWNISAISLAVSVWLCAASLGQQADQIESMKLLTADIGWAATNRKLFWTPDGGTEWKNITPKMSLVQRIDSVFFLDTSSGWVLLISDDVNAAKSKFDLASTTNAGRSWSIVPLRFPRNPGIGKLTGGSHIDFVDPRHGWINIPVVSSAAFRLAILLATADGGRTWEWAPGGSGTGGTIRFTNAKDGWVAGGPGDERLYETHDGAKSWQEVTLKPPPEAGKATHPAYEQPPMFVNGKQGFLPVTFSGAEGTQSKLVLFATDDGGKSWRPDRLLPITGETSDGQWPSTVADSELITVSSIDNQRPKLTMVSAARQVVSKEAEIPSVSGVKQLSFASRDRGWVLTGDKLWLTVDGGASWNDVTPHAATRLSSSSAGLDLDALSGVNDVGDLCALSGTPGILSVED